VPASCHTVLHQSSLRQSSLKQPLLAVVVAVGSSGSRGTTHHYYSYAWALQLTFGEWRRPAALELLRGLGFNERSVKPDLQGEDLAGKLFGILSYPLDTT